MSLLVDFDHRYYAGSGTAVADNVLGTDQIALGGHVYKIDAKSGEWAHQSIPRLKPQQDSADETGEGSLNPEGLWRRSQESWHHGAGQSRLDKASSDPFRFESSKGLNVFDRWSVSMLNDTASKGLVSNAKMVVAGNYLYSGDQTEVRWTTDITAAGFPTWTISQINAGETPQQPVTSLATDGNKVWAALGTGGIHVTNRGAGTSTHYSDLNTNLIAYVNGRLMASSGASIYNVTATGAAPAALFTHPNPDFAWVDFAAGKRHIFAAGYSGDKGLIYKTTLTPEGISLTAPVVAGELPDGEIVRSLYSYLGYLFIGSDKGVRFAEVTVDGDINIGALIPTTSPVLCFEGQDQFVWFGWTNYDSTSSGLGRLDLRSFTASLAPAYASDLMALAQGSVTSVVTFQNRRVFSVATASCFVESTNKVPTARLRTGRLSFGLSESKVAMFADVRYDSLQGTVTTSISRDNTTFNPIGSHSATTSLDQLSAGNLTGDSFNLQFDFARKAGVNLLTAQQSSFEAAAAVEYTVLNNCTVARSTAFAADGSASLAMTALATGASMDARTVTGYAQPWLGQPVIVGRTYTVTASFRSAGANRPVRAALEFYTSTNVLIPSGHDPDAANEVTGAFTPVTVTYVAPAGAAWAQVVLYVVGTTVGDVHYVDKVSFVEGPDVGWTLGGTSAIAGPELSRFTLKAEAVTEQGNNIFVPIILASAYDVDGDNVDVNLPAELAYLVGLNSSRAAVTYQEGTATYLVTVDDYRYNAMKFSADAPYDPEGTFLAKLKVVAT
ncbi:MAG TPA: hypothetical protein VMZ51_08155 [Acidimicrobiales bacterium]|nr:hypothetical protein [Acidimicrobiales bacterium]